MCLTQEQIGSGDRRAETLQQADVVMPVVCMILSLLSFFLFFLLSLSYVVVFIYLSTSPDLEGRNISHTLPCFFLWQLFFFFFLFPRRARL